MKYKLFAVYLFLKLTVPDDGFSQQNITTSFQHKEYSDLNINLTGRVKSVIRGISYPQMNLCDTIAYVFKPNGLPERIVESFTYLNNREVYAFENGLLASVKSYFDNIDITETTLKYDCLGRLTENSDYSIKQKKQTLLETYQYDSIGNLVSYTMDNLSGKIFKKWIYRYDDNGNKVEEGTCENYIGVKQPADCIYNPLHGFLYNEKGQIIRKFDIGSWSPHNTNTYYKYNERGDETEAIGYYISKDTVLGYHYVYQYDDNGNQTMEEEKVGNYRIIGFDHYTYTTMHYDNYQNLIREEYLTSKKEVLKIVRFDYTYDEYGNWTKRQKYEGKSENNLSNTVTDYRLIEYY